MSTRKLFAGICLGLLAITSIKIAYDNMETLGTAPGESITSTQWVNLKVNDFEYPIDLYAAENTLNVGTMNSDRYNTISIGEYTGYNISINSMELPSDSTIQITLDELAPDKKIEVNITNTVSGEEHILYINTLPENYTSPPIHANNPDPGFYYFNLNEYVYKMNTDGEIVFWRLAGQGDGFSGGNDFKLAEIDGKVYYTFLYGQETPDSPHLDGVDYGRMQGLVLDENYQIVDNVQFASLDTGEKVPLDNYQFTMLGEKHYLLTSYAGKYADNIPASIKSSNMESRVVSAMIQEVSNGDIIFEWDSTNHPELYELSTAGNDFYNTSSFWADYAHLDSVVMDQDQNFICSFRNLDTILKIDRTTGDIMWKLGGAADDFGLTPDEKFSKQHDVRITPDGEITLFNNGNEGNSDESGQTTIMKFKLDESAKTVLDFQEYACEGQFSSSMGSAQKTGDSRFVIGWGERVTHSPLFSEIDFESGEILFEILSPSDEGNFPNVYKVYKFDQ